VSPNMRLKLAGAGRSRGSGALCVSADELSFNDRCACWQVARSLSAIPTLFEFLKHPVPGS
jgi:hypothetical protein